MIKCIAYTIERVRLLGKNPRGEKKGARAHSTAPAVPSHHDAADSRSRCQVADADGIHAGGEIAVN
jgi:hypothetical protein